MSHRLPSPAAQAEDRRLRGRSRRLLSAARAARCLCTLFALLALATFPRAEASSEKLIFVLDASGSMWGQIEGENKIVIARRVLKDLLGTLPTDSEVGLIAYGHRREGDCLDVETVVPPGPLDRRALGAAIDALNPKGKTPITSALDRAFGLARERGGATVVLVSDGIETCGGDPCAAARQAGSRLVLHVVGFDVADADVSQLECAAQAGGGLYFAAADASGLSSALRKVVEAPPEPPEGRLELLALANGERADALVRVYRAGTRDEVASGRTYEGEETNPRSLPLAPGAYDIEVEAVRIDDAPAVRFENVRVAGEVVRKIADFSTGELAIEVRRNGELSDATLTLYPAGGGPQAAAGRTYTRPSSNPKVFEVAAGEYDLVVRSVEIAGGPRERIKGLRVEAGERTTVKHEFESGTLRVGARAGDELVDAIVQIRSAEGDPVASGRTFLSTDTNPRRFELPPGAYRVEIKPIKPSGAATSRETRVEAGRAETIDVDLTASGG